MYYVNYLHVCYVKTCTWSNVVCMHLKCILKVKFRREQLGCVLDQQSKGI